MEENAVFFPKSQMLETVFQPLEMIKG